ncbi:MAG: integrin alpha, partial [Planctomycetota bacterium]
MTRGSHVCSVAFLMLVSSALVPPALAQTRPTAFFSVPGSHASAHFGGAVSEAGDVNKDGYQDFLIGAPDDQSQGLCAVHSGKNGTLIFGLTSGSPGDHFGAAAALIGDVDGDGYDDFLVGAPQSGTSGTGLMIAFSGKTGGALFKVTGDQKQDEFGFAVAGVGDVNGDGIPDLAAGAPHTAGGSAGYLRVFSGKNGATIYTVKGASIDDELGFAVRSVGSVDGDACPDFAVGAPGDSGDRGTALLCSGCTGMTITTLAGAAAGDRFGASVSGAGDLDHDGADDVLIGVPGDDTGFANAGSATLFSSKSGLPLCTLHGEKQGSLLGTSVSGRCDVDSDGT